MYVCRFKTTSSVQSKLAKGRVVNPCSSEWTCPLRAIATDEQCIAPAVEELMHSSAGTLQDAPIKNNPLEKCCISAIVVRIWAKLSDFVCEYSHNVFCKFYWSNQYSSSDTAN